MTKLEAIEKLTSGEAEEIFLGDKSYFLIDGAICTARKKALDMKDLFGDGWEIKVKPKWNENIGDGVFVMLDGYPRLVTSIYEDGTCESFDDKLGSYLDMTLATSYDLTKFIWGNVSENKPDQKKKKVAVSEKKEKSVQLDTETPEKSHPKEETADEKSFSRTKFFTELIPYMNAGLKEEDAESFWNTGYDVIKIREEIARANNGEIDLSGIVDMFYGAGDNFPSEGEDEIPF